MKFQQTVKKWLGKRRRPRQQFQVALEEPQKPDKLEEPEQPEQPEWPEVIPSKPGPVVIPHNDLIPIGTLPAELILKIISYNGPSGREASYIDASKDLRYCSQVCHAWRCLALSSPLVWGASFTWLNSMSVEWTRELLRRVSTHSPLSVSVYSGEHLDGDGCDGTPQRYLGNAASRKANTEMLSERLSQIRDLQIRVDHEHELERALQPFRGSAPALSSLSLLAQDRSYHVQGYYFALDPEAFWVNARLLTQLKLRNCGLDLKSPLWPQLTHLEIFYIGHDARAPSSTQWMSILQTCTALVSWSFEGFMSEPKPYPPTGTFEIALPTIAHLRLHLHSPDAIIILSHLRFPSLRSFDVIIGGIMPTILPRQFQILTNALKYHIDQLLPKLKSVSPWHISFIDNDYIRFMKDEPVFDIEGRSTFSLQCGVKPHRYLSSMPYAILILMAMLAPYGFTKVEDLTVYIIDSFVAKVPLNDCLKAALSPLKSVKTLRVGCYTARTSFFSGRESFWNPQRPYYMSQSPFLSLPIPLSFAPPSLDFFPLLSYVFVQPIVPLDTLKILILKRKALGLPIQTLHFSERDGSVISKRLEDLPTKEQFERLHELGPTIFIDDNVQKILTSSTNKEAAI